MSRLPAKEEIAFLAGICAGAAAAGGSIERGVKLTPERIQETVCAIADGWNLDGEELGRAIDEHWENLRENAGWFTEWSGRPT